MDDEETFPETSQKSPQRDWPEFREWANMFVAFAALAISIVSVWTTLQISGLEDYFRSEISRRNMELDEATQNASRLSVLADKSAQRIEDLRSTADRYSAASIEAQSNLLASQNRLSATNFALRSTDITLRRSKNQLQNLESAISDKEIKLDRFRRDQVSQEALFHFTFLWEDDLLKKDHLGKFVLNEMSNFGLSRATNENAQLYQAVREVGPRICRDLGDYNPQLPPQIDTPKLGRPPGKPSGDGSYLMNNKEYDEWQSQQKSWNEEWTRVSNYNSSIFEAKQQISKYVRESLWHCTCVALKVDGRTCENKPTKPKVSDIILPLPE